MFDYSDIYDPDAGYDAVLSDETAKTILNFVDNNETILDIGCGTARISKVFQSNNQIYLNDISKKYLDIALKKIPSAEIFLGNFLDVDFKMNFDNIFIFNNIQEQNNLLFFIEKAIHLLNNDGKLFISYPNPKSLHRIVGLLENKINSLDEVSSKSKDLGTVSMIDEKKLNEIFSYESLELIYQKGICFKPFKNSTMEKLDKSIVKSLNDSIDLIEDYSALKLKIYKNIK